MIAGENSYCLCEQCGSVLKAALTPAGARIPIGVDMREYERIFAQIREALITQPAAERAVLGRKL